VSCLPSVTVLAGFGVWPKENNAAATPLFLGAKPGKEIIRPSTYILRVPNALSTGDGGAARCPTPPTAASGVWPAGQRLRPPTPHERVLVCPHLRGSSRSFVNSLHQPVDDAVCWSRRPRGSRFWRYLAHSSAPPV
jgi:hypothetical protein